MRRTGRGIVQAVHDSLAVLRAAETVHISGEWTARPRRTYQAEAQLGSGKGPYVDVVDYRWEGVASAPCPIAGIAFLAVGNEVAWAKSCPPVPLLGIHVCVTAYANHSHDHATLLMSVGGSQVPGVPVPIAGPPPTAIPVPAGSHPACAAIAVTSVGAVQLFAILLPAPLVRVGRNRLWMLRDEHAQALPPDIRTLLTRRRTGRIP